MSQTPRPAGAIHHSLPEGTPMKTPSAEQDLLTPAEVARLFRVDPKTVTRWAAAGKLSTVRTLGGHRRFHRTEVLAHLQGQQ